MYFFHHGIFLELVKGSQLYFSVSPHRTLYAYQAESLSNCSALHANWIFSNMNHLTILIRATRMLLNLHAFSCLLAQSSPALEAQPTGNTPLLSPSLHRQSGARHCQFKQEYPLRLELITTAFGAPSWMESYKIMAIFPLAHHPLWSLIR